MKKRAMGASMQGRRMAPDIMTDMPMKAAAPAMPMAAAPMAAAPMAAAPMAAMKKGGKVDFSKVVRNKKTGELSEKPGMKGGGIAQKGNKDPSKTPSFKKGGSASKKGGLAIMIMMGKGKKK
jgi:hypothetical protein